MLERIEWTLRLLLFWLVRLYQRLASPILPRSCRFVPSCSNYALEVLQTWPLISGLGLILRRLARCQPLCEGGLDPVPPFAGRPGHRVLAGRFLRLI